MPVLKSKKYISFFYNNNLFCLFYRKFTYKRDSNIHQLKHKNFDNDDKTYNGNSTQQM